MSPLGGLTTPRWFLEPFRGSSICRAGSLRCRLDRWAGGSHDCLDDQLPTTAASSNEWAWSGIRYKISVIGPVCTNHIWNLAPCWLYSFHFQTKNVSFLRSLKYLTSVQLRGKIKIKHIQIILHYKAGANCLFISHLSFIFLSGAHVSLVGYCHYKPGPGPVPYQGRHRYYPASSSKLTKLLSLNSLFIFYTFSI